MQVSDISDYQIEKGAEGERVVFDTLTKYINPLGFILHSYTYPMIKDLPGNIKKDEDGNLHVGMAAPSTELDIVLCTRNFIYPIEVKTYSGSINVTSKELERPGGAYSDKSPVHQNEMHSRHLYEQIYDVLPGGDPRYFKPLVIFADKNCSIIDKRNVNEIRYIPVVTITNACKLILGYENKPNKFMLDVKQVYNKLMKIGSAESEIKVLQE